MPLPQPPLRRLPARRLVAAGGFAILMACAEQPQAATPPAPPVKPVPAQAAPAAAPASPEGEAPEAPAVLTPPNGKWLTDGQGRQYFLDKVARNEGNYIWLNAEKTKVRMRYGMVYDVEKSDKDSFTVKIYRVDSARPGTDAAAADKEKEKEKVAASYKNDTGTEDRLAFEPFGRGLPTRGQWRNGFKIADMNGDGILDIVSGPARKENGPPVIFLGDGKGNWHRWKEVRFPGLPYDYGDVAVADFNGDGRPDIALAAHLRGTLVLVADGPASFKEWSGKGLDFSVPGKGGSGAGFTSGRLVAADWNGDGKPDLVSVAEGPHLSGKPEAGQDIGGNYFGPAVYLNQGDGTWVRKDELASRDGNKLFGAGLAVADFTNAGHLDMILASSVFGATDILRIGDGKGGWTKASIPGLRPVSYVFAVDVADFNHDGRKDLVVGYLSAELGQWRTGVDVFLGRADGTWERKGVAVADGRAGVTAVGSGDLDGDGKTDLVAATGEGELWIFLGRGDGTFFRQEPGIPANVEGCRGYDIHIVNLDADPTGELVAEFAGEPAGILSPNQKPQCPSGGSIMAWKAKKKEKP